MANTNGSPATAWKVTSKEATSLPETMAGIGSGFTTFAPPSPMTITRGSLRSGPMPAATTRPLPTVWDR